MSRATADSAPVARTTAGVVVIGDEVLAGRFADRNTATIIDAMARHGLALGEVAIVGDDLERIAEVVAAFVRRFDLVVTTGGIGPTHDDRTWRAIGRALGEEVALRPDVLARMEARGGGPLTREQRRMAFMPVSAVIEESAAGLLARVGSVWVLPGVPSMVARRIEWICARYAAPLPWVASAFLDVDEWDVVSHIDAVVVAFPEVSVGSYPVFDAPDHRLRLTFTGSERGRVEAALGGQLDRIGRGHVVRVVWSGPGEEGG